MRRVTYLRPALLLPRLALLLLLCASLLPLVLGAAAPAGSASPPFDPKPLLQKADPGGAAPYTFAVFGDSYASADLPPLLKLVTAKSPTFVVTTGDMVSNGSQSDTWHLLATRAGSFLRTFPTWPVIGNHELAGGPAGALAFTRFYHLPAGNYSFTFRGDKFIVLGHKGVAPRGQVTYLQQELANRDKYRHVFVFRHSPFYTVGSKSHGEVPNTPTALTRLFTEKHVTAVFSGHDHSYYRTRRDGVSYLIAAAAGAGLYGLERTREALPGDAYMGVSADGKTYLLHLPGRPDRLTQRAKSREGDWLFTVLVHVDGAKVTAQTISVEGEVWDQFTL